MGSLLPLQVGRPPLANARAWRPSSSRWAHISLSHHCSTHSVLCLPVCAMLLYAPLTDRQSLPSGSQVPGLQGQPVRLQRPAGRCTRPLRFVRQAGSMLCVLWCRSRLHCMQMPMRRMPAPIQTACFASASGRRLRVFTTHARVLSCRNAPSSCSTEGRLAETYLSLLEEQRGGEARQASPRCTAAAAAAAAAAACWPACRQPISSCDARPPL